jgi:hypothetical protein
VPARDTAAGVEVADGRLYLDFSDGSKQMRVGATVGTQVFRELTLRIPSSRCNLGTGSQEDKRTCACNAARHSLLWDF